MQPITLTKLYDIPIIRHVQVKGTNSPDDPSLTEYWEHRQTEFGKTLLAKGSRLFKVAQNQKWKCLQCGEHLYNGEELQQHHNKQVKDGGLEHEDNLELIHKSCHSDRHSGKGT